MELAQYNGHIQFAAECGKAIRDGKAWWEKVNAVQNKPHASPDTACSAHPESTAGEQAGVEEEASVLTAAVGGENCADSLAEPTLSPFHVHDAQTIGE